MAGYAPTPLVAARGVAEALGVADVLVKDESARLDMPSFKILGASWATRCALVAHAEVPESRVGTFADLRRLAERLKPLTLAAATDGNHGRAVARMARLLGFDARIYVPAGTADARIAAIAAEGADVTVVEGGYDDAVRRSAGDASERCLVISDTSWDGYEDVPRRVIAGYETIFAEIDDAVGGGGLPPPDVVAVPIGVGALAAAVAAHYLADTASFRPLLVGVEPTSAACVLESVRAGEIRSLTEPQHSIMAGLNCATPSIVAWPLVSTAYDAYVSVDDDRVPDAMRLLAADGIVAGETGAAGLAGLLRLVETPPDAEHPLLDEHSCVLLLVTEGATDPESYKRIVGRALRV